MNALDRRLNAYRDDLADRRLKGRVHAARYVDGRAMRVRVPLAALRRRPSSDAPLETEALLGDVVLVFEDDAEGWAWVQLAVDGYVGWMESEALAEPGPEPTHEVCVPRTLLFPGPDIKLPPLAGLPMGARVALRGEASDHNARYGLVEPFGAIVLQHLRPIGHAAGDPVSIAERFLGVPYLWGGCSTLGLDCSGLVQMAWRMTGRVAPRDADMQEVALGSVLAADAPLQRGDLVFWKGHVGIMQDSERLLHANAYQMMVASEPLSEAVRRAEARGSSVTSRRRPPAS